jgi:hypothetical protein
LSECSGHGDRARDDVSLAVIPMSNKWSASGSTALPGLRVDDVFRLAGGIEPSPYLVWVEPDESSPL